MSALAAMRRRHILPAPTHQAIRQQPTMAFLTTVCSACRCIALTEAAEATQGQLKCPTCQAPLRVVPGCILHVDEQPLFSDLTPLVTESSMGPAEAVALGRLIGSALRSGGYRGLLESLTGRLPGLLPFQIAVGNNAVANQRLLRVLRAVLEASAFASAPERQC